MASKVTQEEAGRRHGGGGWCGMKCTWHVPSRNRAAPGAFDDVPGKTACSVAVFRTGAVRFILPFLLFTDQLSERPCGRSSSLSAANSSQTNPQGAVVSAPPGPQRQSKAVVSAEPDSPCPF